jgi:L-fucose isomerase-like protein
LGVVLDQIIQDDGLQAFGLRCWDEMQEYLRISPCVLMSQYNDRGMPAGCEVDIGNAVTMYALMQASGEPVACLDWNNDYGDDPNKCILFHCGPVPQGMMKDQGWIDDHQIINHALGKECGYGCNQGRIKSGPLTFASMRTENGKPGFYAGQGKFTEDPIPENFFGCAGVSEIPDLQRVMRYVQENGHRHHVSVTPGHVAEALYEGLTKYRDMEVALL